MVLPVDDLVVMQVLEAEYNATSVEDAAWLREDVVVNVHHEITTHRVLHYKADVFLHRTQQLQNTTQAAKNVLCKYTKSTPA